MPHRPSALAALLLFACSSGGSKEPSEPTEETDSPADLDTDESTPTPDDTDPVDTPPIDTDEPDTDGADTDGADTDEPDTDEPDTDLTESDVPAETDVTPPAPTRQAIRGELTWHIDFRRAGQVDCSYTRSYTGTFDPNLPWACATCDGGFQVSTQMVAGMDCYERVTGSRLYEPSEVLALGEGGVWRMDPYEPYLLAPGVLGPAGWDFAGVPYLLETTVGNSDAQVDGHLEVFTEPGEPVLPLTPPATYACGWPKADPPPVTSTYDAVVVGEVIPDGVFYDTCDEPVRLHDFAGRYLVIDSSAYNCPPCEGQAAEINDLVAWGAGEGLEVVVITLLGSDLNRPVEPATMAQIAQWQSAFQLSTPVLQDRGYGPTLGANTFGTGPSFPTEFIVAPDLTVLDVASGMDFFMNARATIRAHANP